MIIGLLYYRDKICSWFLKQTKSPRKIMRDAHLDAEVVESDAIAFAPEAFPEDHTYLELLPTMASLVSDLNGLIELEQDYDSPLKELVACIQSVLSQSSSLIGTPYQSQVNAFIWYKLQERLQTEWQQNSLDSWWKSSH